MRRLAFTLLLLGAPLLQSSLLYRAAPHGVDVDLALLLTMAAGLTAGVRAGALCGFAVGLAAGAIGDAPLGALAAAYLAAGWLAGLLGRRGWGRATLPVAAASAGCAAVLVLAEGLMFHSLGVAMRLPPGSVLAFVAWHGLLEVPIFPGVRWMLQPSDARRPLRRKHLVRVLAGETVT